MSIVAVIITPTFQWRPDSVITYNRLFKLIKNKCNIKSNIKI